LARSYEQHGCDGRQRGIADSRDHRAAPEPSAVTLLVMGLVGLGMVLRMRRA